MNVSQWWRQMKMCQEWSQNSTGFGPHMTVASAHTVQHSSFMAAEICSLLLNNKRPIWCHLLFYFTSYVVSMSQASACDMDTTPTQTHRNSNTYRTKNNTTNVVIQQNSRKLLMMDILNSETCWAHKKWNKIASDIKLIFYSSTSCILLVSLSSPFPSHIVRQV